MSASVSPEVAGGQPPENVETAQTSNGSVKELKQDCCNTGQDTQIAEGVTEKAEGEEYDEVEEDAISPSNAAILEERDQDAFPSATESLVHCPRRASSSKVASSEDNVLHQASLRTRSLPLSGSPLPLETPSSRGLDGESLGKILSFSNQVSHALMRSMQSLPQSPCVPIGNPWPTHASLETDFGDTETVSPEMVLQNPAPDSSEKGFSVSLAKLRECTMGRGENPSGEESPKATTPSTACAQSMISAIPQEEIDRMIDDVKALDEDTLKQLEDIHVVILHKEEGTGLGFSIAGGIDLENKATIVHRVFPSGLAAQEGTIEKGDEVLSINGQTLKNVTHSDATATLRQARGLRQAVVVVCKNKDGESTSSGHGTAGPSTNDSYSGATGAENRFTADESGDIEKLDTEKTAGGVGFSLEGGRGSIHGDRPLTVSRVFKGGAAEQHGMMVGDEVLQVASSCLQGLTRLEAWNLIKALPEGPFTAIIRRKKEGLVGTTETTENN